MVIFTIRSTSTIKAPMQWPGHLAWRDGTVVNQLRDSTQSKPNPWHGRLLMEIKLNKDAPTPQQPQPNQPPPCPPSSAGNEVTLPRRPSLGPKWARRHRGLWRLQPIFLATKQAQCMAATSATAANDVAAPPSTRHKHENPQADLTYAQVLIQHIFQSHERL